MEICLDKVLLRAMHGLLPAERIVGNDFELNVRTSYNLSDDVDDNLDNSLCYAELFDLCRKEMSIPSDTLEHATARIGNAILSRWPSLQSIEVSIAKLSPPIPHFQGEARVKWHWSNSSPLTE